MATDAIGGTKTLKINELNQKGKEVVVGLDGWSITQKNLFGTVEVHQDAITSLQQQLRMVEQQVKAVARVMANQRVDKLSQDQADAMNLFKQEFMNIISEKIDDVHQRVNREVSEVLGKRAEIVKRVNTMEQRIVDLITDKNDEQTTRRHALQSVMDKVVAKMEILESELKHESSKLKDLILIKEQEHKSSTKRTLELIESEAITRAKALLEITQESEKVNENARSLINAATKDLKSHVDNLEPKLTQLRSSFEANAARESRERGELMRIIMAKVTELVNMKMIDPDKLMERIDEEADRKIAVVGRTVVELKQALGAEKVQREMSMLDLGRELAQERKSRDFDEDRLLSMISTCMASLDRIHRSA